MNRRHAIRLMGGAISLSVFGLGGVSHARQRSKTGLGLVIYTLNIRRRALKTQDPRHDLFEPMTFLEYCHGLGAGGIQVPLGVRDRPYAKRLRDKAQQYGMFVEGIASPPQRDADVERFEAEMRTANHVGARTVRTVIIPGRRYERFSSREEFLEYAARGRRSLERAAPIVERHQVRLAVENHKDQRVDARLELLQHISSEFVGACLDTGNSFALLEDPLAVVQSYAPWAFSVHLKDQAVRPYQDGFLLADAVLGEGFLDLKEMVDCVRRVKPDVQFSLETITRDPLKVPCLAESYWPTFPDVAGCDLARTLRMVRDNEATQLLQVSSLPPDEQAEVELANVNRCLDFAHRQLGL